MNKKKSNELIKIGKRQEIVNRKGNVSLQHMRRGMTSLTRVVHIEAHWIIIYHLSD